ncbi:purine-binding chemotaxis protein CheW [bacterium]|nr:purine-binding chemotaxis protein CheW [bacterium]
MSDSNRKLDRQGEADKYLEFALGSEFFALPLLMVREVIPLPETTPIPKAPAHFVGIMNLRGQVISIIDLRAKLKTKSKIGNEEEAVVIAAIGELSIGVVVDSVTRVLALYGDQIAQVPQVDSQVSTKFIQGVYKKEDTLTMLLDVAGLLDVKDLALIQREKKAA